MHNSTASSPQSAPSGADSRSDGSSAQAKRRYRVGDGGKYGQDLRDLKSNAQATLSGGLDSVGAMRRLAMAELNLSRHAAGRSVVWVAVGAVFGASTWLLLMAAVVVAMQAKLGWSWLASLLVSAAVSGVIALISGLLVQHYFGYTGFKSTKRELEKLGFGDDDDEQDSDARRSFKSLKRRVERAELVAEGRLDQTQQALAAARAGAKDIVTPGRVLAAGAVSGFVVGRRKTISGAVRRTGAAARSAAFTSDLALRGLSEFAGLAVSTFAAFKSAEAADQSADAADQSAVAADQSAVAADQSVRTAYRVEQDQDPY